MRQYVKILHKKRLRTEEFNAEEAIFCVKLRMFDGQAFGLPITLINSR